MTLPARVGDSFFDEGFLEFVVAKYVFCFMVAATTDEPREANQAVISLMFRTFFDAVI